jgi:acetyl esterase
MVARTSQEQHMPAQKMAQPLRAVLGTFSALIKLRVIRPAETLLAKSHEQRLATTVPAFFFRKPNPAIQTQDHYVDGRGGKIHARVYMRPGTAPSAPGYLFIHGGGFIDGGVAHCDHVCRELADRSGFVVVGLSYRLIPEHPFPAGLEDCEDVLTWMASERPGGLDADRIAVGGESAGGNFTIALALRARDGSGPRIAHQAPIYPLTDFTLSFVDWGEGNPGNPGVTLELGEKARALYLPDGDYRNPLASVAFADHTGLPPALVVTCGHDILQNEGVAYAESLVRSGVETTHLHFDDMPHGFLLMTRLTNRAYETMDAVIAEANKHF